MALEMRPLGAARQRRADDSRQTLVGWSYCRKTSCSAQCQLGTAMDQQARLLNHPVRPTRAALREPCNKQAAPPTAGDFWEAWRRDYDAGLEPALPPAVICEPSHLLTIPPSLEWREGRYRHQAVAVERFLAAGARGILQIATGGGKTKTALLAATELQNLNGPHSQFSCWCRQTPLADQWMAEVASFGIHACRPSDHAMEQSAPPSLTSSPPA